MKKQQKIQLTAKEYQNKVGQAVRQTIKKIGGTMPEDLPTPNKSAKQIEKEKNKKLTFNNKKKIK